MGLVDTDKELTGDDYTLNDLARMAGAETQGLLRCHVGLQGVAKVGITVKNLPANQLVTLLDYHNVPTGGVEGLLTGRAQASGARPALLFAGLEPFVE